MAGSANVADESFAVFVVATWWWWLKELLLDDLSIKLFRRATLWPDEERQATKSRCLPASLAASEG